MHSDLLFLAQEAEKLLKTCRLDTDRLLDDCRDVRASVQRLLDDWRDAGAGREEPTLALSLNRFIEENPHHRQALLQEITPLSIRERKRLTDSLQVLWSDAFDAGRSTASRHNKRVFARAAAEAGGAASPADALFPPATRTAPAYGSDFEALSAGLERNLPDIVENALAARAAIVKLDAFWIDVNKKTAAALRRLYASFSRQWKGKGKGVPPIRLQRIPRSKRLLPLLFARHRTCYLEAVRLRRGADRLDETAAGDLAPSRELLTAAENLRSNAAAPEWRKAKREVTSLRERIDDLTARLGELKTETTGQ